jgi:hypothetical protein
MFRDAQVVDRQHTAASFSQALRRYAKSRESWYDGSPGCVDARLAHCDRLLHSARFTVARLSIANTGRYLRAVEVLDTDRRSLLALRDDLLTGASNRADVVGPPGWRTAMPASPTGGATISPLRQPTAPDTAAQAPQNTLKKLPAPAQKKAFSPPNPPSNLNENLKAQWAADQAAGINPTERHLPEHLRHHTAKGFSQFPSQYSPPGFNAGDPVYDRPYRGPSPQHSEHRQLSPEQQSDVETIAQGHQDPPPLHVPGHPPLLPGNPLSASRLAGTDRRWVKLEAAKFIAANADTLDDSHELATRAHAHAALKTSTFTAQRSAAIAEAFVGAVVDLGRQTYRPHVVRTAAASVDFHDSAMYLC